MSRGRHAKRSGLCARLWPSWAWSTRARSRRPGPARHSAAAPLPSAPPRPALDGAGLRALEGELSRLRVLGIAHAAAAASADVRARRAEEQLVVLRQEVAALREELVWAFAEGRLPVAAPVLAPASGPGVVIDLRDGSARSAR